MEDSAVDEVEAFLEERERRDADARRGTAEGGLSPRSPHLRGEEVVMTARGTGGACRDAQERDRERGKRAVDEAYTTFLRRGARDPDSRPLARCTTATLSSTRGTHFCSGCTTREVQAVPSEIVKDCIDQVLARRQHMLESAHATAHLLNLRRRSLRYYDARVRNAEDLEVVQECDNFFLAQTGVDRAGARYLRVREQTRLFHACMGPLTIDLAMRDAEARACVGDDETPRCAAWWQEHGGAYPDLREIVARVLHMWMSASPAERNWAEHERVCTTRLNRLEFAKLAQLVEIATNLKLLDCSESSAGYVLPWGDLDALEEVRSGDAEGGSTGPVDEEPEPSIWGARPRGSVTNEELTSLRRRSQQLGNRRPRPVVEVFGARAAVLLPYEGEVQEEEVRMTRLGQRATRPLTAMRSGQTLRRSHVVADDDPPREACETQAGVDHGTGRGTDTDRTGYATQGRRVFGVDSTDDEQARKDDEFLLRARDSPAPQVAEGGEPLRRSARLVSRDTTAPQTETACSQHLDEIVGDMPEGEEPEQCTPVQEEPSEDIPSVLRTSDFMVGGIGTSDSGIGRRQHVRLGDMADYYPDDSHIEETRAERDARIDAEEERHLSRMQWAGKVAYQVEVERMRRLETIGACGDHKSAEAVLRQDAALQPSGGGHVSPHPPTSLPHTITDRPGATHHSTLSPSPTIMGHADVAPVSASPSGPCGSHVSHAPLTSEAGGSGTVDSESQVMCDVVAPGDIEEPHKVPIDIQPVSDEVPAGDMTRGDQEELGGHGEEGKARALCTSLN
ncbi:hypothetical protein CBR_g30650 [Chara braunii]|uniref:HAT C-terminal dimerisation domain-containing protein n=1 Tax=Chara braunii TaxID=69332 RepID=A0A388LDJ9_CHABU|nr:hypothetical protein CBR_g30650 [Chara braunii]|eukprot:GBG80283.1 hypothetical protein CBR_g30650 [Chara braunii]